MLMWLPPEPWRDEQVFGPSALRTAFVKELNDLGSMPENVPLKIAVACGEGSPRYNDTLPGKPAADFNCLSIFGEMGYLFTWPHNNTSRAEIMMNSFSPIRRQYLYAQPGGNGIDSAPGGVWENPIFREFNNNVPLPDSMKTAHFENSCFIPTASALALSVTDYFKPLVLDHSKFNRVTYSHEGNLKHCQITPTLAEFLIKFMTQ